MKQLHPTTLADALAQWGRHEAEGRHKDRLQPPPATAVDCLNVLLHTRPNMVAHLLKREPLQTLLVELEAVDAPALHLSNGQSLDDWIAHVQTLTDPSSFNHIRSLVQSEMSPAGPVLLVGSMVNEPEEATHSHIGALVLYDGWHRTAAWLLRGRAKRHSPLLAHLVIARRAAEST